MNIDFQFAVMAIGFFITVGTLIWRIAILHHQCEINKETIKRAHSRLDKFEDVLNNRVEELSAQIKTVREIQIRMEEKLNFLVKAEKGSK